MAFNFKVEEHIATIGKRGEWTLELNRVSYNGNEAKLDIRAWNEDHSKMGKGITLTDDEAKKLKETLKEI